VLPKRAKTIEQNDVRDQRLQVKEASIRRSRRKIFCIDDMFAQIQWIEEWQELFSHDEEQQREARKGPRANKVLNEPRLKKVNGDIRKGDPCEFK